MASFYGEVKDRFYSLWQYATEFIFIDPSVEVLNVDEFPEWFETQLASYYIFDLESYFLEMKNLDIMIKNFSDIKKEIKGLLQAKNGTKIAELIEDFSNFNLKDFKYQSIISIEGIEYKVFSSLPDIKSVGILLFNLKNKLKLIEDPFYSKKGESVKGKTSKSQSLSKVDKKSPEYLLLKFEIKKVFSQIQKVEFQTQKNTKLLNFLGEIKSSIYPFIVSLNILVESLPEVSDTYQYLRNLDQEFDRLSSLIEMYQKDQNNFQLFRTFEELDFIEKSCQSKFKLISKFYTNEVMDFAIRELSIPKREFQKELDSIKSKKSASAYHHNEFIFFISQSRVKEIISLIKKTIEAYIEINRNLNSKANAQSGINLYFEELCCFDINLFECLLEDWLKKKSTLDEIFQDPNKKSQFFQYINTKSRLNEIIEIKGDLEHKLNQAKDIESRLKNAYQETKEYFTELAIKELGVKVVFKE